jgi:magnesium transporter
MNSPNPSRVPEPGPTPPMPAEPVERNAPPSTGGPDAAPGPVSDAAPGTPPGAASGADVAEEPLIRGYAWVAGAGRHFTGRHELSDVLADPEAMVWVDVTAPSHVQVTPIAELLELHPLIAEDIAERNQRAKVEEIEGAIHIVMFWIAFEGAVSEIEVDLVLGPRSLLSVHEPGWDPFTLDQMHGDPGRLLKHGPDYLLYGITDGIVDGYFPVLDAIEDEIDALQDDVIRKPTTGTLERLFALKRELVGLRRAMSPAREIFNQLTNRDLGLVAPEHIIYFRDVYDHLIRVTDELDNDRELVAGTLDVYLSTINNNLSTIMKRLTGVTVVFAGMGAMAGIFGMSEAGASLGGLEAPGFWLVTGLIVLGAALTAIFLRRIDWI